MIKQSLIGEALLFGTFLKLFPQDPQENTETEAYHIEIRLNICASHTQTSVLIKH